MSSRSLFMRKIIYLVAGAALLMSLSWLSRPATNAVKGLPGSPGGKLAQLREHYRLSPSQLGQIDPASVTIKLVTLGMRGIAANILWEKANEYQLKKDWTNRAATLNQITKIQPNFVNVWLNQAWNVSYNISVQFDDYRQRYRWILKGLDFLKEGILYNDRQPRLPWELGWMTSQKIGRADECKQFRRLFKQDNDFRGSLPAEMRDACLDDKGRLDNWLVGKRWFERAVDMVDTLGVTMMGKGPLIYRSNGPMCQMSYSDNLEQDGTFGEVAKRAWIQAANDWHRYGSEDIPTSFKDPATDKPMLLRMNDEEMHLQTAAELAAKLDAIQPGLRAKIIEKKRSDDLTKGQREAIDTPAEKRTARQVDLAAQAEEILQVTHDEVARLSGAKNKKEAVEIAREASRHEKIASYINRDREIVNFVYWRMRAEVEQGEDLLAARKLIYQGDRSFAENDLVAARNAYQQGLQGWRKVLDKYPAMGSGVAASEDLMDMIKRYRRILKQIDEPFPEKFILQDILDANEKKRPGG